jgi:hypothetical protein
MLQVLLLNPFEALVPNTISVLALVKRPFPMWTNGLNFRNFHWFPTTVARAAFGLRGSLKSFLNIFEGEWKVIPGHKVIPYRLKNTNKYSSWNINSHTASQVGCVVRLSQRSHSGWVAFNIARKHG